MFVEIKRVPVSMETINAETQKPEINTIYIKPKMGYGSKQRVLGSVVSNITRQANGTDDVELNIGKMQVVLLLENIVGWEGPAFEDEKGRVRPCTPAYIERLDPDQPLVTRVLEEINDRNKAPEQPVAANDADEVGDGKDAAFAKPGLDAALSPNY